MQFFFFGFLSCTAEEKSNRVEGGPWLQDTAEEKVTELGFQCKSRVAPTIILGASDVKSIGYRGR